MSHNSRLLDKMLDKQADKITNLRSINDRLIADNEYLRNFVLALCDRIYAAHEVLALRAERRSCKPDHMTGICRRCGKDMNETSNCHVRLS